VGGAAAGGTDALASHVDTWSRAISAMPSPTLQDVREALARYPVSSEPPRSVASRPGSVGGIPGTWFLTASAARGRRIVYVHGGGFLGGDAGTYAGLCGKLAEVACADVFFVDYRLAPEHRHPAALDDVVSVLQAAATEGPVGHSPACRVALAGDSCGGGLALAAAMVVRDSDTAAPAAIATLSGWFDFVDLPPDRVSDRVVTRAAMEVSMAMYFGGGAVPSLAGRDLAGLPPLLIQVSASEALYPQCCTLAEQAQRDGVPVTLQVLPAAMPHVCQFFWREDADAHEAIVAAGRFLGGEA
jgi:epsilon-lactone hydrolase